MGVPKEVGCGERGRVRRLRRPLHPEWRGGVCVERLREVGVNFGALARFLTSCVKFSSSHQLLSLMTRRSYTLRLTDRIRACHGRLNSTLSRTHSIDRIRAMMDPVARILASGLHSEMLHTDTATIPAQVRDHLPLARQLPLRDPNELTLQPHHSALHCREPTALSVVRPQQPIAIFNPPIQIGLSNHLETH